MASRGMLIHTKTIIYDKENILFQSKSREQGMNCTCSTILFNSDKENMILFIEAQETSYRRCHALE